MRWPKIRRSTRLLSSMTAKAAIIYFFQSSVQRVFNYYLSSILHKREDLTVLISFVRVFWLSSSPKMARPWLPYGSRAKGNTICAHPMKSSDIDMFARWSLRNARIISQDRNLQKQNVHLGNSTDASHLRMFNLRRFSFFSTAPNTKRNERNAKQA